MNRKLHSITLFILLVSLLISPVLTVEAGSSTSASYWRVESPQGNRLSPAVQKQMSVLQTNEAITVIVQLRQKANIPNLKNVGRGEQLSRVIGALSFTAQRTQGPVKKLLDARKSNGRVKKYASFWIFNGFSVTATPDVIQELALHPDVLAITPDELDIIPASPSTAFTNPGPNLTLINAPALWSMGYSGQGVVIASMDSGVSLSHSDLSNTWRGGSNSWYDPYGQHPSTPTDISGHGTWTMGVMVASDSSGTSLGVAPGAQWIAVKMFNDAGSSTATAIHQGYQWLLNPDGNPATADAPQVVNNSWSFAYPGCYLDFEPDLQALRAAGILPVFAAGNGGPSSNTSFSPANNPSAFAVGAIKSDSTIYGLSSRGPSTCGGRTGVFPEIVAPGHNINTTDLGGFYTSSSGTSLAAPHVAGGLALLLSAYPGLSPAQQEDALQFSAFDLGAAGPDDYYGYGRLDLLAAYQSLASTPPTATSLPPTFTSTAVPNTPTSLSPTFTSTAMPNTPTSVPPTFTSTAVPNTPTSLPPTFTSTAMPNTPTSVPPTFTSTAVPNTPTPLLTFTATATALPTFTSTSAPPATSTNMPATKLHIGDLDRSSALAGTKWTGTVTILVHDNLDRPVAGATVIGKWTNGTSGKASCVTNASGICTITKTGLSKTVPSITFNVMLISLTGFTYQSSANHDPDGDSNGTFILIPKP